MPLSAMDNGEFEALLVTVTLPVRLPVLVGSKTALKDADCPAASVMGRVTPDVEKPVPLAAIFEILTLALPVFVNVTVCVVLVFVVTLPKLTDVGEAESVTTEATLVPAKATTTGEVGELFVSERLALKLLAEAGVKLTVKLEEAAGANVSGTVSPENAKVLPGKEAAETVRLAVPVFVIVTVCVFVFPTETFVKLTLVGVTEIAG